MPTKHLLINGKVQGVFYRATAKEVAEEIGLTGWVKNTKAGSVEATVTGTLEQLSRFVAWCKEGPALAKVDKVEEIEIQEQAFKDFTVVRD